MPSSNSPRVLHVVPLAGHRSGGLGPAALGLSGAQRSQNVHSETWTTDDEADAHAIRAETGLTTNELVTYPVIGPPRLAYSPAMERAAAGEPGRQFDVLHQHGMWTSCSRVTLAWHARHGGPTVVAPHGSLAVEALRRSRQRKWLAMRAYEGRVLRQASCMHALSEPEVVDIRDFGLRNPVAVLRNGLSTQWMDSAGDRERFFAQFSLPADARILLFLGRVTPIKGLPVLFEAISSIGDSWRDWCLVIAGPDEFGHQGTLRGCAETLGITKHVRFVGPLFGQAKRDAFAAADLFVLPSHREGAPVAVLEALGAGVPVLTTRGTPWEDLVRHGCGWWAPAQAPDLAEALRDALSRTPEELAAMGRRGKALVSEHYSWETVARQSCSLYEWLIGRANRPDFVVTD